MPELKDLSTEQVKELCKTKKLEAMRFVSEVLGNPATGELDQTSYAGLIIVLPNLIGTLPKQIQHVIHQLIVIGLYDVLDSLEAKREEVKANGTQEPQVDSVAEAEVPGNNASQA